MAMTPSPVEEEDMYSMCSTPLTDSSMGVATVCASVSAVAPGYVALMTTVGGAISGYCATGNVGYAMTPKITMSVDSTAAKIGRSMKKCGKRMRSGEAPRSLCDWYAP